MRDVNGESYTENNTNCVNLELQWSNGQSAEITPYSPSQIGAQLKLISHFTQPFHR